MNDLNEIRNFFVAVQSSPLSIDFSNATFLFRSAKNFSMRTFPSHSAMFDSANFSFDQFMKTNLPGRIICVISEPANE